MISVSSILQQIKYESNNGYTRFETILICEKQNIGLSEVNSFYTYRESLVIPPIPPTDETTSNVCKVRYILRVRGGVSCCHSDVLLEFPITIGSYPILDNMHLTSYPTGRNEDGEYEFPVNLPSAPSVESAGVAETQQPIALAAHHPLLRQDGFDGTPRYPLASPLYRSTTTATTTTAPTAEPPTPAPAYSTLTPFPENGE